MKAKVAAVLMAVLGVALFAIPAQAHHAFTAEFDGSKVITLTGTLTRVDWINPHVWFYLDVKDANGKVTNWSVESNATVAMHRDGALRSMFVLGDTLVFQVNPAKDGTLNRASLRHVKFPNGTEINFKNNNDPPPDEK